MDKKALRKREAETQTNYDMAGQEMRVTIERYGGTVQINADSGDSFIEVIRLAKEILSGGKKNDA